MTIDLHGISDAADKLIVAEETGGRAYYEARVKHPIWPGVVSGVTIGCGYDCGYATASQIQDTWGAFLSPDAIQALKKTAGIKGLPAKKLARELHWISIHWEVALEVFHKHDLPKWTSTVRAVLPNCDKLSGDSFGALVSLAFNRGASFNSQGSRYTEMRAIKDHMKTCSFHKIPKEFLSMRRLWPKSLGLRKRREHEAELFHKGLSVTGTNSQVV